MWMDTHSCPMWMDTHSWWCPMWMDTHSCPCECHEYLTFCVKYCDTVFSLRTRDTEVRVMQLGVEVFRLCLRIVVNYGNLGHVVWFTNEDWAPFLVWLVCVYSVALSVWFNWHCTGLLRPGGPCRRRWWGHGSCRSNRCCRIRFRGDRAVTRCWASGCCQLGVVVGAASHSRLYQWFDSLQSNCAASKYLFKSKSARVCCIKVPISLKNRFFNVENAFVSGVSVF